MSVFGLPYWVTSTPPREYTDEELATVADKVRADLDKMRREFMTSAKINYCRHMDSPAWRAKVEDIYERHPEWRNPEANWWD